MDPKSIKNIPTLPLRDVVIFPGMIFPLFVGRKKSISALNLAIKSKSKVFLVTQKKPTTDKVEQKDIYNIGAIGNIIQMLKLPDGTIKVLIEIEARAKLIKFHDNKDTFLSEIEIVKEESTQSTKTKALIKNILNNFREYCKLEERFPKDLVESILEIKSAGKLSDHVCSSLPLKIADKQKILSELNIEKRLSKVLLYLKKESQILEAEKKIKNNIKKQVENSQKEFYLNEQLKAIKKELGDPSSGAEDDLENFKKLLETKKLSKEAKIKAKSELKKLASMNPLSSEAGIIRGYLEWLLEIPWNEKTNNNISLNKAEDILNNRHYGLEKIKERILEFVAVNKRVKKIKGPILCLVGPPGVGKTSLASSIAESMGRKFEKISLGGMRDEAEIRGHRRTYVGAMPGKIIQLMKKTGSSNPLLLLDEVDKIGKDFRGDPASALLEVLDPEQNSNFSDHYLEVSYDLSEVIFITTANTLDIPYALRDRMEIIRLSGYTEEEKIEIAKKYLIPRQITGHGLKNTEFKLSHSALLSLIERYTYEAGVRNLEREIANLARKSTRKIDSNNDIDNVKITLKNLEEYAGIPKYARTLVEEESLIGVCTGLAYTQLGGDILSIEVVKTPGSGKITYTGKLGDVMKESMQAAYSYFKSQSFKYNIIDQDYNKFDIHIHVPEGATPKDGPSAGIAIYTAIVSTMTNIPVNRLVAMTGEITLRGRILPIGGLKEKLLAALRAGIKTVLIPYKNKKDLKEIPNNVLDNIEIICVKNVLEVIEKSLLSNKYQKSLIQKDKASTH